MLLVALGLLFGLVIVVWCFVLTVTGADSVSSGRRILSVLSGKQTCCETSHEPPKYSGTR